MENVELSISALDERDRLASYVSRFTQTGRPLGTWGDLRSRPISVVKGNTASSA
jgi:hypothetical protein